MPAAAPVTRTVRRPRSVTTSPPRRSRRGRRDAHGQALDAAEEVTAQPRGLAYQIFDDTGFKLFREGAVQAPAANELVLQLQPHEGVSLAFDAKQPGADLSLAPVQMDFRYADYFKAEPATGVWNWSANNGCEQG